MATPNGLEPSTSSVTGWRANRLHHRAITSGYFRKLGYYTKGTALCQEVFAKFFIGAINCCLAPQAHTFPSGEGGKNL